MSTLIHPSTTHTNTHRNRPQAPAGGRYSVLAASPIERYYHSTALLLPSGDLLVMGSEQGGSSPQGFAPSFCACVQVLAQCVCLRAQPHATFAFSTHPRAQRRPAPPQIVFHDEFSQRCLARPRADDCFEACTAFNPAVRPRRARAPLYLPHYYIPWRAMLRRVAPGLDAAAAPRPLCARAARGWPAHGQLLARPPPASRHPPSPPLSPAAAPARRCTSSRRSCSSRPMPSRPAAPSSPRPVRGQRHPGDTAVAIRACMNSRVCACRSLAPTARPPARRHQAPRRCPWAAR